MLDQRSAYRSVLEVSTAFNSGKIDETAFIASVVALPVVRQNPLPAEPWWDSWSPNQGPLRDLRKSFSMGLISASLHDAALGAMIKAGHEA